ncbi:MAG: hypothetical protein ACLFU7_11060 [Armatimonadota bacterium]
MTDEPRSIIILRDVRAGSEELEVPAMTQETEEQVFYYAPPWQKWVLAFVIMAGWTWYHLGVGQGSWAVEQRDDLAGQVYIAMILLVVGALGAAPALTLMLLAERGHVTITDEGLRWRRWWDEKALSWDQIEAAGEPREETSWRWWRHLWFDRPSSIRLVTPRGWQDIECALLREDDEGVYEAIADTGGLTQSFEHDGRTFRSRPGWTPEELPQRHPWRRVPS